MVRSELAESIHEAYQRPLTDIFDHPKTHIIAKVKDGARCVAHTICKLVLFDHQARSYLYLESYLYQILSCVSANPGADLMLEAVGTGYYFAMLFKLKVSTCDESGEKHF